MQLRQMSSVLGAASLLTAVAARSLSYRMKPGEQKACFFAFVDPKVHLPSAILQFYYAASDARGTEVVSVDAVVTGPSGQQLNTQQRQTHAEINIKPPQHGEYQLCLSHHGHGTEKNLDVDITLPTPPIEGGAGSSKESAKLEMTVTKLQHELSDLVHQLRYIKNRERRNLETVDSIESWIFYVSAFEVLLIVGMSLLQVVILRTFFSGNKQRV